MVIHSSAQIPELILLLLKITLPFGIILGVFGLFFCIKRLYKLISPSVSYTFSANEANKKITLPKGKFSVSIVACSFKIILGIKYFSAQFKVIDAENKVINYYSYGFNPLTVKRTDMRGNRFRPIGVFCCDKEGDYYITCTTPELIHESFKIGVSPYINPVTLFILVFTTIFSSFLFLGSIILSTIVYT